MFNLNRLILLLIIVIVVKLDEANLTKEITNCDRIRCDQSMKCKKGSKLIKANDSCCPICFCEACPELNYDICTHGFKPVRQASMGSECCDMIACVSDSDGDDLTISIPDIAPTDDENNFRLKSDNFHTIAPTNFIALSKFKAFNSGPSLIRQSLSSLAKVDKQIQEPSFENEESYDENNAQKESFDGEESGTNSLLPNTDNIDLCLGQNCTNEIFEYYREYNKCPDDSQLKEAEDMERTCCQAEKKCECNQCKPKSEQVDLCKAASQNFEAVLVQKGEWAPGKCCDVFICHSSNFTCNLNGIFYHHNSEWKVSACTKCKCEMGHIKCSRISCPSLSCEVTQTLSSECCPVCTGECLSHHGRLYKSNETWIEDNDPCIECKCLNGKKVCLTESCAPAPCENPMKKNGLCCPYCPNNNKNGNRCPLCECGEQPIKKCPFECDESGASYVPLNSRLCECIRNKCHMKKCDIFCENGYEKNPADGCEICQCKKNSTDLLPMQCVDEINEERVWFDGCRQCTCHKGHQYCSLISCRQLKCSNPIFLKNACCPTCPSKYNNDNNLVNTVHQTTNITVCFSPKNGQIYLENDSWQLDKCTKCTCRNGLVLCDVNNCPPVACSNPIFDKLTDECCPICETNANKSNSDQQPSMASTLPTSPASSLQPADSIHPSNYWSCIDLNERKRAHNSIWKETDCLHCVCYNGETKCFNLQSKCGRLKCAQSILKKGHCCPFCLDPADSPFILTTEIYNLTTLQTSTKKPTLTTFSNQPNNNLTNYAVYLLLLIVIILVLIVVFLLFKNLRRNQKEDKENCRLVGSSAINQSKFLSNPQIRIEPQQQQTLKIKQTETKLKSANAQPITIINEKNSLLQLKSQTSQNPSVLKFLTNEIHPNVKPLILNETFLTTVNNKTFDCNVRNSSESNNDEDLINDQNCESVLPLLANAENQTNLLCSNVSSEISDSFNNDENSKSTLITTASEDVTNTIVINNNDQQQQRSASLGLVNPPPQMKINICYI